MKISYRNIPKFQGGTTSGGISTVNWTYPYSTWFTRSGNNILEGTYNYLKPFFDKWQFTGSDEDYKAYKNAVDEINISQRYGYAPNHLRYFNNKNTLFKSQGTGNWQNEVKLTFPYINNSIGNKKKLSP